MKQPFIEVQRDVSASKKSQVNRRFEITKEQIPENSLKAPALVSGINHMAPFE